MELLNVDTLDEAREKLATAVAGKEKKIESVELEEAYGRILAADIRSPEPVPAFRRSTVDGYALRAADTQGVTESIPVFLEVVERIEMGAPAVKTIGPGQCAYVPTGGMVPDGADAVAMIEYCEHFDERNIAVYDALSNGRNIIGVSEDVREGTLLLPRGARLRPQEVGALASVGIHTVPVYKPWEITIISTGDELVSARENPQPGQIRDINTYSLTAMSRKYGFAIRAKHVLADWRELLEKAVGQGKEDSDIVAVSGGSSQGEKDHTASVLDQLGEPGVFTHGIALKPGKPTILGYDQKTETILMGLPGHPAAAMMVFELLAVWLYRRMTGQRQPKEVLASMATNVAGAPGKTTCLLVELADLPAAEGAGAAGKDAGTAGKDDRTAGGALENRYLAKPVFGKSGLMTTLTKADGYTLIGVNKEGLKAGEVVRVTLL